MAFNHSSVLNQLQQFKGLPTYQFERRIDAFILPYLVPAFNSKYGTDDFVFAYPEFPLYPKHKNAFELNTSSQHSVYADYLLWSKKLDVIFFVEFKTDSKSTEQEQFDTYILNSIQGWEKNFRDYFKKAIHAASSGNASWRKYAYGLDFLHKQVPELTGSSIAFHLNQFYESKRGQGATAHLHTLYSQLRFSQSPAVKLVYLAPAKSLENIDTISNNAAKYFHELFTLAEFANYVDDSNLHELLKEIDTH